MIEVIKKLAQLGTRQGSTAQKALAYLCSVLRSEGVAFSVENFEMFIPVMKKAELIIDGKVEPCVGCGLSSGSIPTTSIASSLVSSRNFIDTPVIYCNPKSKVASPTNFSFAPAIAISPKTLGKLLASKRSKASLKVQKKLVEGNFILVGNTKNPKTIIFSHYDSLGPGAVDNASGTVVALSVAISLSKSDRLGDILFVFDGNEEISYDYPTYWGHGYRVFEERYGGLLKKAKKIVVVDSVGQGGSGFVTDPKIVNLAFPLARIGDVAQKVSILSGDFDRLMAIYHSELDIPAGISIKDLKQAGELLMSQIHKNG